MFSVTEKTIPDLVSPALNYSLSEIFASNNTACNVTSY